MKDQHEKVKHDGRMDGQTDQGNNNIPELSLERADIKKISLFGILH